MDKQMCWLINKNNPTNMALYLREYAYQPWRIYTSYSQYSVPDYKIPGGSKGWATYQHLRQAGWNLIPTAQAHESTPSPTIWSKKAA